MCASCDTLFENRRATFGAEKVHCIEIWNSVVTQAAKFAPTDRFLSHQCVNSGCYSELIIDGGRRLTSTILSCKQSFLIYLL
jgi:hypothetical protein